MEGKEETSAEVKDIKIPETDIEDTNKIEAEKERKQQEARKKKSGSTG